MITVLPMPRESIPTNGSAIKRHRQMSGWGSAEFAEKIGISASHLSRLEGGSRRASPTMLRKIAETLRVPIAKLMPVTESRLASER